MPVKDSSVDKDENEIVELDEPVKAVKVPKFMMSKPDKKSPEPTNSVERSNQESESESDISTYSYLDEVPETAVEAAEVVIEEAPSKPEEPVVEKSEVVEESKTKQTPKPVKKPKLP